MNALQAVRPSERQTTFIAGLTREFLLPSDLAVLASVLADRDALPLTRLYRHLFDSTHTTLHVVTPNYDRLAEYAADAADVSTFTGFNYGYLQTRARDANTRVTVNGRQSRTVAVWKVHGSLDWFQHAANQIVGVRSALIVPAKYTPLMITPGIDKYRLTHGEPFRTILSCSDKALDNARSYFCVGYGFNDEHVQTKLVERCDRDSVPLVVVTKELTPSAKAFLTGGRCRRYLAVEEGPAGARAYMHHAPTGFDLDKPIWRLEHFLDHIIGTHA
ncbi:SIR2 family protein [Bradyrhizobium sp. BEA-2-5]|uniref:SIR2 family protein n=1 Tax=Bradyrhizobium sp. BEA-2-5 TaxID=3080015 RepID=UPI00293EF6BE|nr:SIR2 family protein [Bradyrhizobium sp. BEA-2-5]WOH80355.1 SIR2 family protein [Bradyrhizobium sp. BEA-2-5]